MMNTITSAVPKAIKDEKFFATTNYNSSKSKLYPLTSLRFFAAAMIVIYHSFGLDKNHPCSKFALDQGVSYFFVLSGFILSYAYPSLDNAKDILRFLTARIARIWPAYLIAALAAICLLHIKVWQPVGAKIPWITIANFSMIHGWILEGRSYFSFNVPSWSISTEFFFYLLFPILIWQWNKTWKFKLIISTVILLSCVLGASLIESHWTHTSIPIIFQRCLYINPFARIFEFIAGMVVFKAYKHFTAGKKQMGYELATLFEISSICLVIAEISLMPLIINYCTGSLFKQATIYWLRFSGGTILYAILILAFALGKGALSKFLTNRLLVGLGDMSYSIYLFHWIISRTVELSIKKHLNEFSWFQYTLYWLILLFVSYLSYTYVERISRQKLVSLANKLMG